MKAISTFKFVALLAALLLTSAEALILNYDAQHRLLGYTDATSIRQTSDL